MTDATMESEVDMKENRLPEISVDEIMRTIEEEIAKKRNFPHDGMSRSGVNSARRERGVQGADLIASQAAKRGFVREILWKYGTRYAALIKKVPGLNRIAEYYYWRLSGGRRPLARIAAAPSSGCDILAMNLNYAGFIEGLKHEGLKGKIKRRIFTVIGFFAWWQGQVNGALYDKLAWQGARLTEQEARLTEQGARLTEQEARLTERDEVIERLEGTIRDLGRKLSVLSQLEDAIYEELTAQRVEIARQRGPRNDA